jgi:hypothetical protein
MAILGTKKFWKPALGSTSSQKESQILKNNGYISLQLKAVNYMSKGDFWQQTFGGKDNIALTTTVKYQKADETIEATSVQDVREVRSNKNYNLGIQRNIAVKIPATANAIALEVKITAVRKDALQAKFDMLNQPEYQSALQLAPLVVGKVFTITSLVKKLFTDSDPATQLEASYAGLISLQPEDNPVSSGKLTEGTLIIISTNDGETFSNADEQKFEVKGETLFYNNKEVENTYVLFNISFEALKGDDEDSIWFKKYSEALSYLDKIQLTEDPAEIAKILAESKNLWMAGNALFDADPTYISREKIQIKNATYTSIKEKHAALTAAAPVVNADKFADVLKTMTGSTSFRTINSALPSTGSFLQSNYSIDPLKPIENSLFDNLDPEKADFKEMFKVDKNIYLKDLKKQNLTFKLGEFINNK